MEFRDLKKQYAALQPQMDAAIHTVLENTDFISGAAVTALEQQLAAYTGRKHCIACANGTDALVLILEAWGIGPGDAVFVPDFTFFASGECASNVGATPIFIDVDETTFNMDPAGLDAAITAVKQKGELVPRVVVAVDLFGLPANYPALEQIAQRHGLLLLEDAAQGFGGRIGNAPAGSFGDATTFSFFPAKPLGCYGDGGAILTDNDEEAALLRSLTVHGKGTHKYDNVRIGHNSRLDTMQAAILQVKLAAFDDENDRVDEIAALYTQLLQGQVATPVIPDGYRSGWAQYTLRLSSPQQREALAAALREQGIPTMVYYPKPMSSQTAFSAVADKQVCNTPVTKNLCETVLSLPIHPYLTDDEAKQVASAVIKALG